jgi:nitronate monooxygenase
MSDALLDTLGLDIPIIQAPMAGGATTPELVSAVSNTGALGAIAAGYLSPEAIKKTIQATRALTDKIFAVNLFVPENSIVSASEVQLATHGINQICEAALGVTTSPVYATFSALFDAQMAVVLEAKVRVFSFTFGLLAPHWMEQLKKHDVFVIGTATSLTEAYALRASGVDAIVLQGTEAGGHRGTFEGLAEDNLMALFDLLSQCRQVITDTPLIAAGGIADGEKIKACLALGAAAVQIGTAFLTTYESGIDACYKTKLLSLEADATTLTRVFSGKLARGINNRFIHKMREKNIPILSYPAQNSLTQTIRQAAKAQNNTDYLSMWAGQSAASCQNCSVEQLMLVLMREGE